jgi:glycosyltransferase involved in cell wall biosynthesis
MDAGNPPGCSKKSVVAEMATNDDKRFPILIVGNLLSKKSGVRSVCEDLSIQLENDGWPVLKTSTQLGKIRRITDMVWTVIRNRRRFDVAHVEVYSGPAFVWAEAVCWTLRRLGKPFVLTLHGGNLPDFAKSWPRRVRRVLDSATFVTTPSNYLFDHMRPYCDKLQILPNAVDIRHYPFRHRTTPKPKLVWLRSFSRIYNPSLAPKVIAGLMKEFPDAELLMIGPDKFDGSFEETQTVISQLGLEGRVRMVGRVEKHEVPGWLNQGDIFINTTNFDNTPVSLLEAMACGMCVVSTNVGGIPYLVKNNTNAILVEPDDADEMAMAVQRCLMDQVLASSLSQCARETVEAYDWPVILPKWRSILADSRRSNI